MQMTGSAHTISFIFIFFKIETKDIIQIMNHPMLHIVCPRTVRFAQERQSNCWLSHKIVNSLQRAVQYLACVFIGALTLDW